MRRENLSIKLRADMNTSSQSPEENLSPDELEHERAQTLDQLEAWLETPMVVLGFVFLALVVVEILWETNPLLETIGAVIWVIFGLEFLFKFALAPQKWSFLKSRWLTVISLLLPALRVFRIFRLARLLRFTRTARVARGLRLVRIIGSLNRGMNALRAALGRRGFGYALALTTIVVFVGAAGMFAFESDQPNGLSDYPSALWWTAMLMTTLGSEYWPQSLEGRVLCFLLSVYAFAVFGYVTATLATYFLDREAANTQSQIAGADALSALHNEIAALRHELRAATEQSNEIR
jgi:voltage-gated potassium channel